MRETQWIEHAARIFGTQHPGVTVGIGDDCAILESHGQTLVSTDTVVEGVHLDRALMSYEIMGWRALAVALSDLAACGADPRRPRIAMLAAQIPSQMSDHELLSFARGLQDCAREFNCSIDGGDTVSTPGPFSATLTVIGFAERAVRRSGAQAHDLIAVSGPLGQAGAGLLALRHRLTGVARQPCIDAYLKPQPLLETGFTLAQSVTAMIDISDGLLKDLGHLARAGKVGAQVDLDKLPMTEATLDIARSVGVDGLELAATFGDDYQLLFCFHPSSEELIRAQVPSMTVIGRIADGSEVVALRGGKPVHWSRLGYEHGVNGIK